jgi:hypothetical protein
MSGVRWVPYLSHSLVIPQQWSSPRHSPPQGPSHDVRWALHVPARGAHAAAAAAPLRPLGVTTTRRTQQGLRCHAASALRALPLPEWALHVEAGANLSFDAATHVCHASSPARPEARLEFDLASGAELRHDALADADALATHLGELHVVRLEVRLATVRTWGVGQGASLGLSNECQSP